MLIIFSFTIHKSNIILLINGLMEYFDNASTTSVDSRVLEAMLPYFSEIYGNASSAHDFGKESKQAIELSRK